MTGRGRANAGSIGWKEPVTEQEEGSGRSRPRSERPAKNRWGFDAGICGRKREGSGSTVAVKGQAHQSGGGCKKQRSGGGNRVSMAKASDLVRMLGDVGCRQWQRKGRVGDVGKKHGNGGVDDSSKWGMVVEDHRIEVLSVEEGGVGGAASVVGDGRVGRVRQNGRRWWGDWKGVEETGRKQVIEGWQEAEAEHGEFRLIVPEARHERGGLGLHFGGSIREEC